MGEAGCLKDGVFKNLQVNGNIDLENAISKSMPLRKTVIFNYNNTKDGAESVAPAKYVQKFNLPSNAAVYAAYGYVKTANTFNAVAPPTEGDIKISGGVGGTGITLSTGQTPPTGVMTTVDKMYKGSAITNAEAPLGGEITITPDLAWGNVGTDKWTQVGSILIVLEYFLF